VNEQHRKAEQILLRLFEGLSRTEQMALMARLEDSGGSLYLLWPESERNAKARAELLAAAEGESANARILRLMTEPKEECARCHRRVGTDGAAYRCSFQCTFCPECAASLAHTCPNCAGELISRLAS
jgi:uncharacterized protein